MHQRTLGKSDVRLSEIALGTWGLASDAYGRSDERRFIEVLEKALEIGVTTIDMAPLWGDGNAERVVHKALGDRRDELQYITRAGLRFVDGKVDAGWDEKALREDLEGSLERLGTDRIDVWLLHEPPEDVWKVEGGDTPEDDAPSPAKSEASEGETEEKEENDEKKEARAKIVELAEALKKEGKIRAWGASASTLDGAKMAVAGGADAVCMVYNVLHSDDLHELSGAIAHQGCGVLARSPLSYGLLAGRWAEYRSFPRTDHRKERWSPDALRTRVRQVDRLRFLVHDEVKSLAEGCLRYVLANQIVTTALVGARTPPQIVSAARAADGPPYLEEDDMTRIPEVLVDA